MKQKLFVLTTALLFSTAVVAQLRLPSFLSHNMVLQQQKANRIWGRATAEQLVTVTFQGKTYPAFANEAGEWEVFLEPAAAGKAGSLLITSGQETIELKNILLGELWVCSGQSNMEWKMGLMSTTYPAELQTANNDQIRFVVLNRTFANTPQQDVTLERNWSPITPETIGDCSAVAYWFAKQLQQQLKVPVGLVVTSWGGTPAQAWTSFEGLHAFPNYTTLFQETIKPLNLNEIKRQQQALKDTFQQTKKEKAAYLKQVQQPAFDDAGWKEMQLPLPWERQGFPGMDGMVVYRLAFTVGAAEAGKEGVLHLPAVDDSDSTYINGVFLGTTNQWNALRTYKIPAGVLKEGRNVLVIQVQDDGGEGGLSTDESHFYIAVSNKTLPLAGQAKYEIIAVLEDITRGNGSLQVQPAMLYNGMIAPLLPLSIKGVIWYQGESNASTMAAAREYRSLFPAMITDWRNRWGQGNIPFLFVQLSSFGPLKTEPAESAWALLREAQTNTLSLPNTAMAVTIDVGNPTDIHPVRKKEVGDRLAGQALRQVYGHTQRNTAGPQWKQFRVEGNRVVLQFTNTGKGLMVKGTKLQHFAVAGADRRFYWAEAVIRGNQVYLTSRNVPQPVAVRYAWADSPVDANLYNAEGYPAGPFRTDEW